MRSFVVVPKSRARVFPNRVEVWRRGHIEIWKPYGLVKEKHDLITFHGRLVERKPANLQEV